MGARQTEVKIDGGQGDGYGTSSLACVAEGPGRVGRYFLALPSSSSLHLSPVSSTGVRWYPDGSDVVRGKI